MNENFKEESNMGPEKVIKLWDPLFQMKGYLVIDNSIFGVPAGGIRFAPNVSLEETIRLARSMTYKFCTYGVPTGGAKSTIEGDPNEENKKILITSFAKAIEPFVKQNLYYPGPDMGTNDSDLERIFNIIGRPELTPRKIGMKKNSIPVEELFTGYGVCYCVEEIVKILKIEHQPKIILEGFGKVGTGIAMRMLENGYKLLGLSTIKGAIFDAEGLEIEKLLVLKQDYGDNLVNQYESNDLIHIEKENLFNLSMEYGIDIIIPGARPDAINENNFDKINAKAIVPAANIPYAKGITEKLYEKGTISFPDFVSNAGEILALAVINNPTTQEEIFQYINDKISKKTREILIGAKENNTSSYEYAKKQATKLFNKKQQKNLRKTNRLNEKF